MGGMCARDDRRRDSVADTAPLETVVATMERARIKRVPVTHEGQVIGVVSRSDLLRALVSRMQETGPVAEDDSAIRTAILDALERQAWAPTTTLNVTVPRGWRISGAPSPTRRSATPSACWWRTRRAWRRCTTTWYISSHTPGR